MNNNNMETLETILRGLAASICSRIYLLDVLVGRRTLVIKGQEYKDWLWSSPNSSHLNRLLSLQHKFSLSSLGNDQQSEEAGQIRSCYFAHQSGGSSPSSSPVLFAALRFLWVNL